MSAARQLQLPAACCLVSGLDWTFTQVQTTRRHVPEDITSELTFSNIDIGTGKGKVHPRTGHEGPEGEWIYSRISFCDGSFYDDSLLRPLSSRTEHSRLVVHHYRNSSVLSVLSALLALFWCAGVSYFSILVKFFKVDCDFSTHDVHKRDRKEEKIKQLTSHSLCLLNHGLGLLQQNKKWLGWYFFSVICVFFFCIPNSLN